MKQIRDLLIGSKEPDLKNVGWVSFDKNTQKYELKFYINGRWLPIVSNIDTIEPEKIEEVKELIEWINNNGTDFNNSKVSSITWNNDTNPSNMNDFVVAGVYDIKGERTRANDNLPILNTGGGHSFNARLTVLDSSIPGDGKNDDKCITQVLSFSNRLGQGEIYIRTGKGSSLDNLTWEKWGTLQRNVNVDEVGSLDDLKDNGIYSGVWLKGHYNTYPITFVCVVINDYFIGVAPRRISQFVYGLSKFDGSVVYQSRVWDDSKGMWNEWEILNQKEITSMISAEIKKVTDGIDPKEIDSIKDIVAWIEAHGGDVTAIYNAIQQNTVKINAEISRAKGAEQTLSDTITENVENIVNYIAEEVDTLVKVDDNIKSSALGYDRQTPLYTADKVTIKNTTLDGKKEHSFDISAATPESAGVMSAEDKRTINNIENNITSVESDNAEELELVDRNGKTLIRVNSNGVSIDEDEVILSKGGILPKKSGEEESILLETESGKPIVRVTATGVEIPKVINKSYNCSILSSCYINKTGSIISNGTMNVYVLKTSGLSVINIDLLAPSTNGLPAFVGKKDEQVVTYKNHTGIDRQVYTVDVTSFDTLYINVSKSGGTEVFTSQEELLNYESSMSGKVGLFLGDSLMQGVGAMVGYDAVSYVEKQLGCKCYNGGVGGTTMRNDNRGVNLYKMITALTTDNWSEVDSFIESLMANNTGALWQELGNRFQEIKLLNARDISFIFINYGANDWKSGATLDNEDNKEDVTTVCGSLRYAIRHILEWNPTIQIFVSTPGYRTDEIATPEINGVSMGAFCDKIQYTCEELHMPCWNQYKSNGVNQYNADLYLSDGTHRSASGYALLGQQYTNFISNHLNNITL